MKLEFVEVLVAQSCCVCIVGSRGAKGCEEESCVIDRGRRGLMRHGNIITAIFGQMYNAKYFL